MFECTVTVIVTETVIVPYPFLGNVVDMKAFSPPKPGS